MTNVNGIISVNLQFDYEDEKICYRTPYLCGEMKILLKEDRVVRCLMPKDVDWNALIKELNRQSILLYRRTMVISIWNLSKGYVEIAG